MRSKVFLDYRPQHYYSAIDGWLRKQVGRPWNEVYSDIVSRIKEASLGKYNRWRLMRDLSWKVERDIILDEEGIPYSGENRYRRNYLVNDLYIDPEDGILKYWKGDNNPRQDNRWHVHKIYKKLGEREFVKRNDTWYEITRSKKKVKKAKLVVREGKPVFTKVEERGALVLKPLLEEWVEEKEEVNEYLVRDHDLRLIIHQLEGE